MEKIMHCKKHGDTLHVLREGKRFRCKKCAVEAVKKRRYKLKIDAINYKGGKCEICGYNKCMASMEFHHLNSNEKKFDIGTKICTKQWKDIEEELDKCMLLCSNCHREIHNEDLDIEMLEIDFYNESNINKEKGSVCPTCGNSFKKVSGKIYCSKECREKIKNYPSLEKIEEKYKELKNWDKVAKHFNTTRRIIQIIRNK